MQHTTKHFSAVSANFISVAYSEESSRSRLLSRATAVFVFAAGTAGTGGIAGNLAGGGTRSGHRQGWRAGTGPRRRRLVCGTRRSRFFPTGKGSGAFSAFFRAAAEAGKSRPFPPGLSFSRLGPLLRLSGVRLLGGELGLGLFFLPGAGVPVQASPRLSPV